MFTHDGRNAYIAEEVLKVCHPFYHKMNSCEVLKNKDDTQNRYGFLLIDSIVSL